MNIVELYVYISIIIVSIEIIRAFLSHLVIADEQIRFTCFI